MSQSIIPESHSFPCTIVKIKDKTFIVDLAYGFAVVAEGAVQGGDRICFFEEVEGEPLFYHWNESLEEEYGKDVKEFTVVIRES